MNRILKVNATGEAVTKPDIIEINLTLISEDTDYTIANNNMDLIFDNLSQQLNNIDFDKEKIITLDFAVNTSQKYIDENGYRKTVFDKFIVKHVIKLEFEFNLKYLSKVIDAILKSNSNPTFTIEFSYSNMKLLKDKALIYAMANARHNASIITKANHLELSKIVRIDNNVDNIQIITPRPATFRSDSLMLSKSNRSSIENINVDNIKAISNISIEWEIK